MKIISYFEPLILEFFFFDKVSFLAQENFFSLYKLHQTFLTSIETLSSIYC